MLHTPKIGVAGFISRAKMAQWLWVGWWQGEEVARNMMLLGSQLGSREGQGCLEEGVRGVGSHRECSVELSSRKRQQWLGCKSKLGRHSLSWRTAEIRHGM